MTTQQLFKKIHLVAAFVTMTFLLMYFISGYLMVRHSWFSGESEVLSEDSIQVQLPASWSPKKIAQHIQDSLELKGKLGMGRVADDGSFKFELHTPRTEHQLQVNQNRDLVKHKEVRLSTYESIVIYHRIHVYGHQPFYNLYIGLMDLASLALIVFVITGVYLWIKLLRKKLWGIVALSLGVLYTLFIIIGLLTS